MGNKSQLDEIDEQIALAFSNAKEKEKMEQERALYSMQVEKTHELNANLEGLAKKFSLLEVKADKAKASIENLFTVGLSEESKKMVRDQLNDIFGEKIAQLKKETDEEVKRVRKEGNRVAVPHIVAAIISITLVAFLFFLGYIISANANSLHSEWLTDCIEKFILGWCLAVGIVGLTFYLQHRYPS